MTQSTVRRFISQATQERPIGVILTPLRVFLGVTFIYAGLLKLSSPDFFSQTAPNGVLKQMQNAAVGSPISFIVQHAVEHYKLAGYAIAVGELFVGIGILFGIWTRLAASFAFILSASFWLTVSWSTSPYFFGPDVIFMAAVTPLMIAGDGAYLSVGARIRSRIQQQHKASIGASDNQPQQQEIDRRTVVRTGAVAGGLASVGLLAGGIGRMLSKTTTAPVALPSNSSSSSPTSSVPSGGVKIASASAISVGSAFPFTDSQGSPAFLLQPAKGKYLAYSAVCTHQGCIVGFDSGSNSFQCPCHGAGFDGQTGQVTAGPAPSPLAKIAVVESGGNIYMV